MRAVHESVDFFGTLLCQHAWARRRRRSGQTYPTHTTPAGAVRTPTQALVPATPARAHRFGNTQQSDWFGGGPCLHGCLFCFFVALTLGLVNHEALQHIARRSFFALSRAATLPAVAQESEPPHKVRGFAHSTHRRLHSRDGRRHRAMLTSAMLVVPFDSLLAWSHGTVLKRRPVWTDECCQRVPQASAVLPAIDVHASR